jgi:hypothetical protein
MRKVKREKEGGKPKKRELGFEGIKGWEKGKEGGFFFLLRLDCYAGERRD